MSDTSRIPTVYEAVQISMSINRLTDKLEELTKNVNKFIGDNADAHETIKSDVAKITVYIAKLYTNMKNIESRLDTINGTVKDVPLLNQWKTDHQKKCEDIQHGHKKKHDEILKDVEYNTKDHEKVHDEMKKDSKDKNSYIIAITAIIISVASIFIK